MSVRGSSGSPCFNAEALAATRSTNSSWIGRSMITLRVFMQIWPWWKKVPNTLAATAASRSASSSTRSGL